MGEKIGCCVVALAMLFASPATASPWNRDDGRLFTATTANYYWSKTDISRYARVDSDTYVEYGLTPKWMTGGRVSYGVSFSEFIGGSLTQDGFNETEIYIQRQILRGSRSATALKITGGRSGRLSLDAQSGAPTPNMEVELRALYGRDVLLEPFKIFATAEVGYRRRFGGDADQVRTDLLVGVEPHRRLMILLEGQSIVSLKNEEPSFADFDLYKGQASVVWRASEKWALVAGGRKEFKTRNITSGTAAFVGVWSTF
ncbi:MAG: hypothetical protein KDE05_09350 [Parvularculaceae bacterium]|nr:hypothetical protein [Parvularculaceae bacterium]